MKIILFLLSVLTTFTGYSQTYNKIRTNQVESRSTGNVEFLSAIKIGSYFLKANSDSAWFEKPLGVFKFRIDTIKSTVSAALTANTGLIKDVDTVKLGGSVKLKEVIVYTSDDSVVGIGFNYYDSNTISLISQKAEVDFDSTGLFYSNYESENFSNNHIVPLGIIKNLTIYDNNRGLAKTADTAYFYGNFNKSFNVSVNDPNPVGNISIQKVGSSPNLISKIRFITFGNNSSNFCVLEMDSIGPKYETYPDTSLLTDNHLISKGIALDLIETNSSPLIPTDSILRWNNSAKCYAPFFTKPAGIGFYTGSVRPTSTSILNLNAELRPRQINILCSTNMWGITMTNNSTGVGYYSSNTSTGQGSYTVNAGAGEGISVYNQSSGKGVLINNVSTGIPFTVQNSGSDVTKIDGNGNIITNKYQVLALNTAPSSATDTGTTGEIRYTADYIYVCTATNTWKRVLISTW